MWAHLGQVPRRPPTKGAAVLIPAEGFGSRLIPVDEPGSERRFRLILGIGSDSPHIGVINVDQPVTEAGRGRLWALVRQVQQMLREPLGEQQDEDSATPSQNEQGRNGRAQQDEGYRDVDGR